MNSLFSHGEGGPAEAVSGPPPAALTAEVIVPQSLADSFGGFTDGIHLWWPAEHTHLGEGTHPEFTAGELLEEDASGHSAVWATLVGSPSDSCLELAWHHQSNPNLSSHVTISFAPDEAGTRVSVVHDGWARGQLGHEQLASAPDWIALLALYRRFMGGAA